MGHTRFRLEDTSGVQHFGERLDFLSPGDQLDPAWRRQLISTEDQKSSQGAPHRTPGSQTTSSCSCLESQKTGRVLMDI
ncbi:hypothetical protein EYF80_064754 [Liparis tanakae]|uniref:Uncharacterized protein n=1 Tax=Liparis tanakae TaxID=230148 RepID=A0A4Z2E871_9TELE|nr:hypothetical protein EYF80_064754 [Liparis tanakae]